MNGTVTLWHRKPPGVEFLRLSIPPFGSSVHYILEPGQDHGDSTPVTEERFMEELSGGKP